MYWWLNADVMTQKWTFHLYWRPCLFKVTFHHPFNASVPLEHNYKDANDAETSSASVKSTFDRCEIIHLDDLVPEQFVVWGVFLWFLQLLVPDAWSSRHYLLRLSVFTTICLFFVSETFEHPIFWRWYQRNTLKECGLKDLPVPPSLVPFL